MEINEQNNWTKRQTYLALSNLLIACAELKIDACPMEGFEVDKYNDILGLGVKVKNDNNLFNTIEKIMHY